MILLNRLRRISLLQRIVTAQLAGLVVQLVKTDLSPTDMLVSATVQDAANKANFTGYANVTAVSFQTPEVDGDGNVLTMTARVNFRATGNTVGNTIYGWVALNTAANAVVHAEKFASPIPIADVGDAVPVVLKFKFSNPTSSLLLTA